MIVIFCECRFIKQFLWMVCKLVKYFGTVLSIDEMGHQCKFLKDTAYGFLISDHIIWFLNCLMIINTFFHFY
jgi:hypothetical protein